MLLWNSLALRRFRARRGHGGGATTEAEDRAALAASDRNRWPLAAGSGRQAGFRPGRGITTPRGRFGSARLAADVIGANESTVRRRIARGVPGWRREAGAEERWAPRRALA